ncbi:MAG: DUF4185 domain-containing protein [Clostridiales bacterium]|nr:DUF4185 domain-containing protein [Clostridiales bacterium]
MRKKLIVLLAVLMALSTAMFALSLTSIGGSAETSTVSTLIGCVDFDEYEDGTTTDSRWASGDPVIGTNALANDDSLFYSVSRYTSQTGFAIYNDGVEAFARIRRSANNLPNQCAAMVIFPTAPIPTGTKIRATMTYRVGTLEYEVTEGETPTTTRDTTFTYIGTYATRGIALVQNTYNGAYSTFTNEEFDVTEISTEWMTSTVDLTLTDETKRLVIGLYGALNTYVDVKEVSIYSYNDLSYTPNYAGLLVNNTEGAFDEVEIAGGSGYLGGLQAVELFGGKRADLYSLSEVDGNLRITSSAESADQYGQIRFRYAENLLVDSNYEVTLTVRKGTTVENGEYVPTDSGSRHVFWRIGSGDTAIYDQITTDFTDITVTVPANRADSCIDLFMFAEAGSYLEISAIKVKECIEPEEVDPNAPTEPYYETIWKTDFGTTTGATATESIKIGATNTYGNFLFKQHSNANALTLSIEDDGTDKFLRITRGEGTAWVFISPTTNTVANTAYTFKMVARVVTIDAGTGEFTAVSATTGAFLYKPNNKSAESFTMDSIESTGFETYEITWTPTVALNNNVANTTGCRFYITELPVGTTLDIKSIEIYDPTTYVDPTIDTSIKPINLDFNGLEENAVIGGSDLPTELTVPENTFAGGFISAYNGSNGTSTVVADDTYGKVLRMRNTSATSYQAVRFTLAETIPAGTYLKLVVVFKPTDNFAHHDNDGRGIFVRPNTTVANASNDCRIYTSANTVVDQETGWYTYTREWQIAKDIKFLQFYQYGNVTINEDTSEITEQHGLDLASIYIEEIPEFTSTTLSGNMGTTYKYVLNDRSFDLTPDETQLFGGITGIVNKSNSKHVAPVKISENNTIIIKSRSNEAYWTGFGLNLKDKVSPSSTYKVSMKLRTSETFDSTSSNGISGSLAFRFSELGDLSNFGTTTYYDLYNEATADSDGFRTVNFTINSTTSEDINQLWLYLYGTMGSSVEIADIKIESTVLPIVYYDEAGNLADMSDSKTLFDGVASADETKEFIGWYNPKTGLLPAGADVSTLTLPTIAKLNPIYATLDYVGASVKIVPNQASGLQFRTKVDVDATFVEANNITFNTIIAPKDYVDQVGDFTKEAFDEAGLSLLDTNYQTNLINYNDEYDYFVGNIVNLYNFNYAREFYGRGYITVDYANDTTKNIYADIDLESDERSIYNVAVMYYNDLTVEDADALAVAKSYIDAVVNVNVTQVGASVVNPYDGIDNNRDYQVPYTVSFNTQTKELTVTANEGSDWNLYSQLGNNYYRASIIINGDRKTPSSTDVVVPASTIVDLANAVTSFDLTNFEFPPLFELKSFTQQSFVTGYSEEVVSQEEGDALYGQNITIGRDSLNSVLSEAVGFGSADLGIPVYDADNGQMYMLYGDTFSSHGYGDSSVWQKYDADINHVNMTMAKTDKYSYDAIEANGGLKLDSFLTDTGFATEGNLKSPIDPVSGETSKLTTGAVIVNGTIYLFYSSNVPNTTVNNGGDGINLVYSGCIKSTDGVNWERVDDLTWTAFATDNANILDLAKYAGILDGDTNVVGGGVERISRDMDVTTTAIKEDVTTGAKYLDIAKTGDSYERMLFTFYEDIPATTVELTIRFKVSDDFAHNDSSSKRVLMAEFQTTAQRINITESIIEGLTPDENGWYTYTGTKTLTTATPYLRFYTWGNAGSILVDSFTVSVEGKNSAVLDFEQFDAGTAITNDIALYPKAKALNSHVAWHFTQMTPVQGDTGEYLYFYGQGGYRVDDIYMARVLKANIEDFSSYEYFAGRDENDASTWDSNPANAKPLIEVGTVSNISVAYNAGLNKWMFTYFNAMTETVDRDHKLQVRFADTIDGVYSSAIDLLTFESKAYQEFINYDPLTGYPNSYTYGVNQFYGAYVSSEWISDDGLSFYICMSQYNDCYNTSMVKVELQNVQ